MSDRDSWNGRAVMFAEFNVGVGDAVIDAFALGVRKGSRMLLVAALRYADTGEPVFDSIADVEAQPFRLNDRLTYLASRCAFLNGMGSDPDAVPPERANGSAEEEPVRPPS
jgi:hypothetical protein